MSLFNKLVYYTLIGELVVFIGTLVPVAWVPLRIRKQVFVRISKGFKHEFVKYVWWVLLLIVGSVFFDTAIRLYWMEHEFSQSHADHAHDTGTLGYQESAYAELQRRVKKFYNHRNLYLSTFTLFMILVLYRRFKDIYEQMVAQETIQELKAKVASLEKVEPTSGSSSGVKASAAGTSATKRK